MGGHVPGSWQSQRCQASICLSWGNSVCCDWKLCLFTFMSGMCVCVWCVSWYQHYQAFLLLPRPPVSWQVFGVCHVCVCAHRVSVWDAHDFSQMESLPFVFRPITASSGPHALPEARPTHLYSKHSRPHFSVLSPPSHFLPSSLVLVFPSSFSLLALCSVPALSRKSIPNLFNSTWLCTHVDARTCAHAYAHTGRRTWNRCLDNESPSWEWTDDSVLWPFPRADCSLEEKS